jgi:pantoate--beta-alanine ligase
MIRIWSSVAAWRERRRALAGRRVGFVPTMGALHKGHAALIARCRAENEIVVVSIFVNPTQFNDPKDLGRYPRTLESDLALLESLHTDDLLMPEPGQIYPNADYFRVEPDAGSRTMEGAFRPGYLQGVLTVVLKLLNIVEADRAYFGEKDYQQLQVIATMAQEFFLSTKIVPCPTVREDSGLAASSRNTLLSSESRNKAAWLFRALNTSANPAEARALLEGEGFRVEYVEDRWGRRLVAAFLDGVRLIDNISLDSRPAGISEIVDYASHA